MNDRLTLKHGRQTNTFTRKHIKENLHSSMNGDCGNNLFVSLLFFILMCYYKRPLRLCKVHHVHSVQQHHNVDIHTLTTIDKQM